MEHVAFMHRLLFEDRTMNRQYLISVLILLLINSCWYFATDINHFFYLWAIYKTF